MRFLRSASIVLLAAGLVGAASADSDVVKSVKSYYSKEAALLQAKNIAGIKKLILATTTADYVASGPGPTGRPMKASRDQSILALSNLVPNVQAISVGSPTISNVSASKNSATLTVTSSLIITTKPAAGGSSHKVEIIAKKEETWIKISGSWMLKASRQLSASRKLDGRPIK